uniref:Berberine/berberine-like domain-containing protein n=1 Tax=Pseudictyota dubia TaxID=2749911 RepID=A0A7R9Z472_9STRA
MEVPGPILKKHTNSHGLLVPELKDETMTKLATYGMFITHFQHGAAFEVADDATALPWRNAGIMMSNVHPVDGLAFVIDDQVGIISEEDPSKVQGYYNTIGPLGTPDWQRLYFGTNYERLMQIKAKYDAGEVFSKPMGVELPKQGEYCPTIPPAGGSATNGDDEAKDGDGSGADSRSSAPRASAIAAGGFLCSVSVLFSLFFVVAVN